MSDLDLTPRFQDGDAFYKSLINAIDAADEDAGVSMLARLVLILANHVGDEAILESAIVEAARGVDANKAQDVAAREAT